MTDQLIIGSKSVKETVPHSNKTYGGKPTMIYIKHNHYMSFLYQLPQNLIGFLVKLCTRARKVGDHYEYDLSLGSVSLGKYIFLCPDHWDDIETLKHEYGHQKQSQMLGWFYLLVIGIPSIIWAGIHQCFWKSLKKHNITYYWFYTEKWANKLGGVNDENRLG